MSSEIELTNLNRAIHEGILGLCWHEVKERTKEERIPVYGWFGGIKAYKLPSLPKECMKCSASVFSYFYTSEHHIGIFENDKVNYATSLDSIAKIEEMIIEKGEKKRGKRDGRALYVSYLSGIVTQESTKVPSAWYTTDGLTHAVNATARQRAMACLKMKEIGEI